MVAIGGDAPCHIFVGTRVPIVAAHLSAYTSIPVARQGGSHGKQRRVEASANLKRPLLVYSGTTVSRCVCMPPGYLSGACQHHNSVERRH